MSQETYKFEVIHMRLSADEIAIANQCNRCKGEGKEKLANGPCAICGGSGQAPKAGYAYRHNRPVAVGDIVLAPPNWQVPVPQEATVVRLGTTYEGDLTPIRRMVRQAANRPEMRAGKEAQT
jgi:hypothetical protein